MSEKRQNPLRIWGHESSEKSQGEERGSGQLMTVTERWCKRVAADHHDKRSFSGQLRGKGRLRKK